MSCSQFGDRLTPRWRAALPVLACAALAIALAGCATGNPQSTIDPRGDNARNIYDLFIVWIFWPAVVVFLVVEGVLVYSVWRYRARPGDPLPPQIHGNTTLEIGWTIIPAIILITILVATYFTQDVLAHEPKNHAGKETVRVRVIGHQWWWEFEYPDLGVVTANELHIPVGAVISVDLESADVIHSFWVPHLAGKQDVIPGRINHLWMRADEPGQYNGQCAEFCGIEHALMRVLVFSQSDGEFQTWVREQRAIPSLAATPTPATATGATSLVAQGAQLFANGACVTCHTVRGTPAQGKVGPDLTHFGSRTSIAANTLTKDKDNVNLRKWLHNSQAVKPGADMPNLNLSDQDTEALAAYLQSLR